MPFTESAGEHRPVFYHPKGEASRLVTLSVPERLDYFTRLPLFENILDCSLRNVRSLPPTDSRLYETLVEHAEFYEVPANTAIFQEGSFGEHLFIILKAQFARTLTSP
jgi:hypothetical protein